MSGLIGENGPNVRYRVAIISGKEPLKGFDIYTQRQNSTGMNATEKTWNQEIARMRIANTTVNTNEKMYIIQNQEIILSVFAQRMTVPNFRQTNG